MAHGGKKPKRGELSNEDQATSELDKGLKYHIPTWKKKGGGKPKKYEDHE